MAELTLPRSRASLTNWRVLAAYPGAALGGIVTLALVTRFVALGHQSVWLDEASSVVVSHRSPASIISFVSANDTHPPLYYLLLHYWMQAFGQSEDAIRSLSAIFGVATVLVTYRLGRSLFGERTGLMAAFLVAISPLLIWYSQEARMYSLLLLLCAFAAYCLSEALNSNRPAWWLGYSLAMAAALYTDNGGLWFFLSTNLYFALQIWREPRVRLPYLVAQTVVVLIYLPWLPSFLSQMQSVTQSFWLTAPSFSDLLATFIAFNSFNMPLEALGFIYLTVLLLWVHLIPGRYVPRRGLISSWLFTPLLLSYALSWRQPIFLLRNLIVSALAYYLLVARAIWSFENRRYAYALVLPLVLMNVVSIYHNFAVEKKEQWREAAAYVDSQASANQLLLFDAAFVEMPFRYYDKSDLPGRGYPADETLVHGQSQDSSDLAKTTQGFSTVWLVLSHSSDVDAEGKAKAWLDQNAKMTDQKKFKDIEVLRYEKAGSSNAPQRPAGR